MKNYLLAALMLCFLGFFANSCTDEPDDIDNTPTIPTSYLKYNGQYFELTKGYYFPFGNTGNTRSYTLYLTGPNVVLDSNINFISGSDQAVGIRFCLPYNTITFPVYNFSFMNNDIIEYTYDILRFDTNYTFPVSSGLKFLDTKKDTIFVNKTGNIYNLEYKGNDANMNPFEIKYKGTINFVENDN